MPRPGNRVQARSKLPQNEVHRPTFFQEGRTELRDQVVCLDQLPPKQMGSVGVAGSVLGVFGEGNRGIDVVRKGPVGCFSPDSSSAPADVGATCRQWQSIA